MLFDFGDGVRAQPVRHAALFIDFDQMLNQRPQKLPCIQSGNGMMCQLLHSVLEFLECEKHIKSLIRKSYADFESLAGEAILSSLHFMGFETGHFMRLRKGEGFTAWQNLKILH